MPTAEPLSIHWTKLSRVVTYQAAKPVSVVAQAPAVVIRRHSKPIQKAMPVIGAILNQISSALITFGTHSANATPPATTQ